MSGLKIIKASAGSGKTHTLTQEYIKLLLPEDDSAPLDTDAYRHILAVTFTNKATDEMKSRVIEYLKNLSLRSDARGRKAKKVLTSILHDYSSFSVSTIDKFFQSTMRSFAREIGQFSSYKVELDEGAVMKQCVDLLMSSLEDPDRESLLKWLEDYSMDLIENGRKWDVSSELERMVSLFMREDFKIMSRGLSAPLADKNEILALKSELDAMLKDIPSKLVAIGEKACRIMDEYSLAPSDFSGGSRSAAFRFVLWKEGQMTPPSDTMLSWSGNPDRWFTSGTPASTAGAIVEAYSGGLGEALDEAISFFENDIPLYNTALMMRRSIYLVGIFSDIHSIMERYLKENNVVLLGETADVLSRIIDGNDTPFIYEKIGVRYDHYMLDEFQDTSRLQWLNFLPLVKESLSGGHSNLIVGDIKQSIYRWRGSDMTLLSDELRQSFDSRLIDESSLESNWRSCPAIVEFNNSFFTSVGAILSQKDASIGQRVTEFYSDSVQKVSHKGPSGYVKVAFFPRGGDVGASWEDSILSSIESEMKSLESRYALSDVAFLVRYNFQGALVAGKLLSLGYDVVTDDSLSLSSSACVMKVVSLLKRDISPDDKLNEFVLQTLFAGEQIPPPVGEDLSLYERCEQMLRSLPGGVPSVETPYVMAFLDCIVDYEGRFGSDTGGFLEWWDASGSERSISAPQNRNAVRIMTIHKSKGLKFEAVVIPFLEYRFAPSTRHPVYLWCAPRVAPFDRIGLVPLRYSEEMSRTVFRDDYLKEKLMMYVDNINLSYVAMTRAVSYMSILAPEPKFTRKGYTIGSVSDVLYTHLSSKLENGVFRTGCMIDEDDSASSGQSPDISSFTSVPIGGRLSLSLRGEDFYNRKEGIVNHDILSSIDTEADIKSAVEHYVSRGELSADEAPRKISYMESLLCSVASRHWFDGSFRSFNELSIVLPDGSVQRPDRVLVEKNSTLGEGAAYVIDYKFGERLKSHHTQVAKYMSLLSDMGYGPVHGAVWYCNENVIEDET